ncbi:hypothetical protein [Nostoc sp. C052]|nr:hypothetical protein [Nostoc sp. C052]
MPNLLQQFFELLRDTLELFLTQAYLQVMLLQYQIAGLARLKPY